MSIITCIDAFGIKFRVSRHIRKIRDVNPGKVKVKREVNLCSVVHD